jgi:hypothetical protein
MAQVGRLYIDVHLLSSLLNFPPDHGIVDMGFDQQNGGYLIVAGPTLPHDTTGTIQNVVMETSFWGNGFAVPGEPAPSDQQSVPHDPFMRR